MSLFEKYKEPIVSGAEFDSNKLSIAIDGNINVQYSVFDYVNRSAQLIILGITPGKQQAIEANRFASMALMQGKSDIEAQQIAKKAASFAGPMRSNLISILDSIGLNRKLGIGSTSTLWTDNSNLVHFDSALRYPVFVNGANYSGATPKITARDILKNSMLKYSGSDLANMKNAMILPLGKASEACDFFVKKGLIRNEQVLRGLPHPSGANAERIAYFLGLKPKEKLSSKTNAEKIDSGRQIALQSIEAFF